MTEKLEAMFAQQRAFQESLGMDYDNMTNLDRIYEFKEMKLALEMELAEALDEMGWKPWASSKHFNQLAVQGELVDAWHFFMNLCFIAGMTPEDLMAGYLVKNAKNKKRQVEGYDGVSTKCPHCKRALDDDAVKCMVEPDAINFFCGKTEKWYYVGDPSREFNIMVPLVP